MTEVPTHEVLLGRHPQKRLPAQLDNGIALEKTLPFDAAYCVNYGAMFELGNTHLGAYLCLITLSDQDGWSRSQPALTSQLSAGWLRRTECGTDRAPDQPR